MKRRSVLYVYVMLWLTAGLYLFYWLFMLTREINSFRKAEIVNSRILLAKFIVTLVLYSIGITILFRYALQLPKWAFSILFFACGLLAIYWIGLIVGTMRKIGREIGRVQKEMGVARVIDLNLLTALLFLYFSGVPYLQWNINKVISDNTRSKSNNSSRPN